MQARRRLKVLFAVSELYPLVKTGGLADAACYLPIALADRGIDIRIVLPAYEAVKEQLIGSRIKSQFPLRRISPSSRVLETSLADGGLIVYLVDCPDYFERPGNPYMAPEGGDWPDNAQRFALFARTVCRLALGQTALQWRPELVHCNDWHTGLAPALLAAEQQRPATVFAIHNLAYQGRFPYSTFVDLALPPSLWNAAALEFHGDLSFIKGGLVFADRLVAVSPGYAREILTPEHGHGLDGVFRERIGHLSGILNGVDYRVWDPRIDEHIVRPYWIDVLENKLASKRALQQELGLGIEDGAFLIGHIGRLTEQKGTDLLMASLPELLRHEDIQVAILGSGNEYFQRQLQGAAQRWRGRVAVRLGYSETLAHRIEAGADCFLMPSREEPCGLSQLYSLRYGTVPIVHATGGLADTVSALTPETLRDGSATGFQFHAASAQALCAATLKARNLFRDDRGRWNELMCTGMQQDFSWDHSAEKYHALYLDLIKDRLT